jgi:hypothetical protein
MLKHLNRILFWLLAIVPLLVVIYILPKTLEPAWFFASFILYLFVFRPAVVVWRLLTLNEIDEKAAWKFFIPLNLNESRYFYSLWLG